MTREQRRKIEGFIAMTLSTLAAILGLFWLIFILGDVLVHGIKALNLSLFINDPVPAGVEGGAEAPPDAEIPPAIPPDPAPAE